MKYRVFTRPYNIGGGWRRFKIVEAESCAQACDIASGDDPPCSQSGFNRHNDGTFAKPFICWSGDSEIAAELLNQSNKTSGDDT